MAASMSKAVVGSIVSLIVYIMSFSPFMAVFVLEESYNLYTRFILVRLSFVDFVKKHEFHIMSTVVIRSFRPPIGFRA